MKTKNNKLKAQNDFFKIANGDTQTLTNPGILKIKNQDGDWESLEDIVQKAVIQTIIEQQKPGGLLSRR